MVISICFTRNCQPFPKWLYHFISPLAVFLHPHQHLVLSAINIFSHFSHSNSCVVFHCDIILCFPKDKCWTSFCVLSAICVIVFGEVSVQIFCPFYSQVYVLTEFWEFFLYYRYKPFIWCMFCKNVLSVCFVCFPLTVTMQLWKSLMEKF